MLDAVKFANLMQVTVSLYLCRMVELGVSQLPRKAQFYDPLSKGFVTLTTSLQSLSQAAGFCFKTLNFMFCNILLRTGSRELSDPHPKNYTSEI